jgi:hypothetical protein
MPTPRVVLRQPASGDAPSYQRMMSCRTNRSTAIAAAAASTAPAHCHPPSSVLPPPTAAKTVSATAVSVKTRAMLTPDLSIVCLRCSSITSAGPTTRATRRSSGNE